MHDFFWNHEVFLQDLQENTFNNQSLRIHAFEGLDLTFEGAMEKLHLAPQREPGAMI